MKSPKLIGNLTPGAAIGFSQAKALQNTGAPFLTASAPGVTTRTKNGFTEVETTEDKTEAALPYLWTMTFDQAALPGQPTTITSLDNPKPKKRKVRPPLSTGVVADGFGPTWLGDRRILTARYSTAKLFIHQTNPLATTNEGVEGLTSGANADYDTAIGALPPGLGTCATGWGGTVWRYRWLATFVGPATAAPSISPPPGYRFADSLPTHSRTKNAVMRYLDGTAGVSSAVDTASTVGDRAPIMSRPYCAGPGRALAFLAVIDGSTLVYQIVNPTNVASINDLAFDPSILLTEDHGNTWTLVPMTTITDALGIEKRMYVGPVGTVFATPMRDNRMIFARDYSATYVGDGKTLCFAGYEEGDYLLGDIETISASAALKCFTLIGTTFTEVTAPAGANLGDASRGICFGRDCFVMNSGGGFISTRDGGATWQTTAAAAGLATEAIHMECVSPYVSPKRRGVVLIAAEEGERIAVYRTDGMFTKFKRLGLIGAGGRAPAFSGLSFAAWGFLYFFRRTKMNLALPDEFNAP